MTAPPTITCWPFDRWPDRDQALWTQNCTPSSPYDDGEPRYGGKLREASLRKIGGGYGRWLDFLDRQGWLDPAAPPLARVTRHRLRLYFQEMRQVGNRDHTIIGRFNELHMAMKILAPGEDVAWILRPTGATIYALLSKKRRPMIVPDSGVLFDWGCEMMDQARVPAPSGSQLARYRIGLFIAVLAARGRRLRSMALLRVGHELIREDEAYRVELQPEQVKTDTDDIFTLPDVLVPYMDHYLDVVRPALLAGRTCDALWITKYGTPWGKDSIAAFIQRLTWRRFGVGFGPHRFRHAIATTAVLRAPDHRGLAGGVLNTSAETIQKHYTLAGSAQAVMTYDQVLERRRQALRNDTATIAETRQRMLARTMAQRPASRRR